MTRSGIMSIMQNQIIPTTSTTSPARRSWAQAYFKFLLSPKENLVLKVAPIFLLLGAPEVIVSNFLPVVGEVTDLGALVLWAIVITRTVRAVRRHHAD